MGIAQADDAALERQGLQIRPGVGGRAGTALSGRISLYADLDYGIGENPVHLAEKKTIVTPWRTVAHYPHPAGSRYASVSSRKNDNLPAPELLQSCSEGSRRAAAAKA